MSPVVTRVSGTQAVETVPPSAKAAPPPPPATSSAPGPAPRAAAPAPAAPAPTPARTSTAKPPQEAPGGGAVPAGGTRVSAPLPGTIVDVRVSAGQTVTAGQVLCILEAMKMGNEIMAPVAGTVAHVAIQKGASVNAGDLLLVIR